MEVAREFIIAAADPAPERRGVLAEHIPIPLGDSVKLVNKISQNLHTEMLLRTAARQNGLWSDARGFAEISAGFLCRRGNRAGRRDSDRRFGTFAARSGDAASDRGAAAVRAEAAVVCARTTLRCRWRESMARCEDRMKNTIAAGRIHAKTGSVEHVRTRSGFAELPSGRRLIFSFLSNNKGRKES